MQDDAYFMGLALAQAHAAALAAEVPVGAVVVKDGQVIAQAYNAPIALHDPSAHAEIQALRAAARALGNYRLDGCELYVTLEPCAMCAGAMLHARIKRVVFGANEPKTGAAGSVLNLFENAQLNHQTRVEGGVLAAQCGAVLQDFFRAKRLRETDSVLNTPLREDALRTPEVCFAALADFPWQGHYVNNLPALNGLRMHYVDEGPPTTTASTISTTTASRVFLCLHGHADWGYTFRHMLPLWRLGGHRVVVPDLVGFGKSDKPKRTAAHSLQFHQQTMVKLIERLDLRNIVLVMQDSAAALGQGLLLWAPERFVGTVRIHLQANEQDALGYACPYPDAGHKAALRASVFTAHGTANGHAATGQNQNSIGTALALHDLGDVPSHQAPQCAQTILTLFAAG